jgi:hypothetical protein
MRLRCRIWSDRSEADRGVSEHGAMTISPIYVRLSHVTRSGRIIPAIGSHRLRPDESWRSLVDAGTLSIWRVDRCPALTHAPARVLAHLSGHGPVGVERVWARV